MLVTVLVRCLCGACATGVARAGGEAEWGGGCGGGGGGGVGDRFPNKFWAGSALVW